MKGRLAIRTRIAGGSLVIAMLLSIVAGIVINAQIERIVREGTVAVLQSETAPYVVALGAEPNETFDSPGPSQHVAVVAPDASTPLNTLPHSITARLPELIDRDGSAALHVGTDGYIVLVTPVDVSGAKWNVVAARTDTQEATILGQMRTLLILGLVIISLGVGLTAWLLTSASLAPVQRLRLSAESLSASKTGELLPVSPARDEISRLATTLNELITRLRASATRERQLVSDASHELRTPIAILTTQLQLAASQASSVEQLQADIAGARRNVARLSALVTSLLELSSYEAGDTADGSDSGNGTTAAELQHEAQDAVERAAFRASNDAHTSAIEVTFDGIEGSADSSLRYAIRAEDWGRAIDNLCSNALRALGDSDAAADRPRRLEVRIRQHGHAQDSLSLTVSDTGGGLSPEFEPHAFERFTRQDSARGSGGVGLGLAIVAAIVDKAGGSVALLNRPGLGLDVTITLAAREQPTSPSSP